MRWTGFAAAALLLTSSCVKRTATDTLDEPASIDSLSATSITPPDAALDDGCGRKAPVAWLEVGTSATVVQAQEPLVVTIEAGPGIVCSGGSISVSVTVLNEGAAPLSIPSARLMLGGGGMWKWDVGELSSLTLDAGQSVTIATVATLPLVKPGEYQLFVYGYTGGGSLSIAAPRGE